VRGYQDLKRRRMATHLSAVAGEQG